MYIYISSDSSSMVLLVLADIAITSDERPPPLCDHLQYATISNAELPDINDRSPMYASYTKGRCLFINL